MRSTLATVIVTFVVTGALVALGIGYMYSGRYNVAATAPHNALSRWILQTTQENSVRAHAQKVGTPPQLTRRAQP